MELLKKIFPLVFFVVVLMVTYWAGKQSSEQRISIVDKTTNASHKTSKISMESLPTNVVVDLVKIQDFYEQLNVLGSGRAFAAVDLVP